MIKRITQLTVFLGLLQWTAYAQRADKIQIGYIYPAGGQQGTTFEVIVGGQNFQNVTGIMVNDEGIKGEIIEKMAKGAKQRAKKSVVKEQENEQLSERIKIKISIGANVTPGTKDFRLATPKGFSNRMYFEVGQLPEVNEAEPNDDNKKASVVPVSPILINGQIMPGERDFFQFQAKKGDDVVCMVKARALIPYLADAVPGWFQSVIVLRDSTGKEIAYNDDYKFQPDPVIVFNAPYSGKYILEIFDAIYRGREDFVYRVTVGKVPLIRSIYPLGGKRGENVEVTLDGVNLPSDKLKLKLKKDAPDRMPVQVKDKGGLLSNSLLFEVNNFDEFVEKEQPGKTSALVIPFNFIVNGCIDTPGDEDWYYIDAKQKEEMVIDFSARKLGSPLDADITLFSNDKTILAQNDDLSNPGEGLETHHADPGLNYTFKEDGKYFIRIRDIQHHGGKEYGYRMFVGTPKPDFDLRIEPSNLMVNQGGTVSFTVHAIRKNNFNGAIALDVKGLPSGYELSKNIIRDKQEKIRMTLTSPENAPIGPLNLKVEGIASRDGVKTKTEAKPAEELMQAFIYTHLLTTGNFLATVTDPLPFSVQTNSGNEESFKISKEKPLTLKVKVDRKPDFTQPVQLVLDAPPKGIKMKPVTLSPQESEAEITIEAGAAPPNQEINLIIAGIARIPNPKGKQATQIRALAPAVAVETPQRARQNQGMGAKTNKPQPAKDKKKKTTNT